MIRKTLAALTLITGVLALASGAPASAGGGPVDYAGCVITVDPTSAGPGDSITVSGTGLQPNFSTPILFDGVGDGTANTDAAGAFSADITVPADHAAGSFSIEVSCDTTGVNVSATDFTVTGADTVADLTLSKSVVHRLETFVATVTNAQPGSTVNWERLSVRTPVGTSVANADGVATLTISFPADAELGTHHVEATGVDAEGDAFDLTDPIDVIAETSGAPLPTTGSNSTEPLVLVAIVAIIGGMAFVMIAKRRRTHAGA